MGWGLKGGSEAAHRTSRDGSQNAQAKIMKRQCQGHLYKENIPHSFLNIIEVWPYTGFALDTQL